jgi:DNA-directed RNA polymerase sigma subunit (sigma70/sigma32)
LKEGFELDDDPLYVDSPLRVYLDALHEIPPMSREEEIERIRHVLAGDPMAESAAKDLAEAHLLLVVSIAERYRNDRMHILDLIQEGNNGLLRAVETLNECRHDSFAAHATPYVERAIAEAVAAGSTEV